MNKSVSRRFAEVQGWPVKSQLTLASRILQSVEHEIDELSPQRRQCLLDLIGILKSDKPPNDMEVDRAVEDERM